MLLAAWVVTTGAPAVNVTIPPLLLPLALLAVS
jgi:hypothetical protein